MAYIMLLSGVISAADGAKACAVGGGSGICPDSRRACRQAIHKIAQRFRDHEVHNFYKRQFYEYRAYAGEAAAKATVRDYRRAYKHTRCSGREYILFRFYEKSREERDTYLTNLRRDRFIRQIGDDQTSNASVPGNKILFNMLFERYLCRAWINPTAVTPEGFAAFVKEHGRVMVKPACDGKGHGITVYHYEGDEAARAYHDTLVGEPMLVEEMPIQHPQMDRLNPHCLNTVRVTTYTDRDAAHILMATLRSATDASVVDNFHAGGIAMAVDLETGRVVSDGVDEEGRRFSTHPHTHVPLRGFQLPNWAEAMSVVRRASREMYNLPRCRFLGWDIAFLPNDQIAVIECNWQQGMQTQAPHERGFRLLLKALDKRR